MASSGSTFSSAPTTYSGRSGVVALPKLGRTNASHSARQAATSVFHSEYWRFSDGAARLALREGGDELRGKDLGVGDDAQRGRIVAAELLRVEVDVDEPGLREVPRVARMPARGGTVVETRADGEHEVGVASGLVGRIRAVAADEAERERIVGGHAAHAVRRGDHRNAPGLLQLRELGTCLGERRAMADEKHRPHRVSQKGDDS